MANQMHPNSRRVNFIFSKSGMKTLQQNADKEGVSVATLIRQTLHETYFPNIPDRISEAARLHRRPVGRAPQMHFHVTAPAPPVALPSPPPETPSDASPALAPESASPGGFVCVVCDSFSATQRDGRIMLEIKGAVASPDLPHSRNYLTPVQVAKRLHISGRTLRKLMTHKTNPIPFIRFGGKSPRFVEEEIWNWAQRGESCSARSSRDKLRPVNPNSLFGGTLGRL